MCAFGGCIRVRQSLYAHAQTGLSSPAVGVWWAVGCMVGGRAVGNRLDCSP